MIAEALVEAKEPLLITGYSGRNHAAPGELVKLAETVKGLRVLDTGASDMCFPSNHRASFGLRCGVDDSIKTARRHSDSRLRCALDTNTMQAERVSENHSPGRRPIKVTNANFLLPSRSSIQGRLLHRNQATPRMYQRQ